MYGLYSFHYTLRLLTVLETVRCLLRRDREMAEEKRLVPKGLTPFKPGQSGNPSGRPKGKLIDKVLVEVLGNEDSKAVKEIAEALIRKTKRGDVRAAHLIVERTEGKPKQHLDVRGDFSLTPMSEEKMDQRISELLEKWRR